MTRRLFLVFPWFTLAADTPRNRLVEVANQFHGQYADWAEKMNTKVGTLNAAAVEAFQPLPNLWRKVENLFAAWVRGM